MLPGVQGLRMVGEDTGTMAAGPRYTAPRRHAAPTDAELLQSNKRASAHKQVPLVLALVEARDGLRLGSSYPPGSTANARPDRQFVPIGRAVDRGEQR